MIRWSPRCHRRAAEFQAPGHNLCETRAHRQAAIVKSAGTLVGSLGVGNNCPSPFPCPPELTPIGFNGGGPFQSKPIVRQQDQKKYLESNTVSLGLGSVRFATDRFQETNIPRTLPFVFWG